MTYNSNWPQLNKLKPSIPRHTHIQLREYNGETWYLLHDKLNGRFHRFNGLAYRLIGFMDGRNSLDQIIEASAVANPGNNLEDIATREDLIELLQYLYVADLLICDFPPNTQELFKRKRHKRWQYWSQLLKSPFTWRIQLFNPDRLLDRLLPLARLLATPTMGVFWLLIVSYALLQVGSHWSEISSRQLAHILSPQNLFLLWLTYPVLKVLHELGHGLFTKVWGGNVYEFGVVFILGTPLPYVDATAATAFGSKQQRLMVSAAGMAVELFLASLALIAWLNVQGGVLKDVLFNIVLIGSVSTLFFNGNPLMRFDGYYLLCDFIDQPNLATRAQNQFRYVVKRFGYGVHGLYSPATSRKEALGLTFYSVAAFFYRLFILATIVYIVALSFPKLALALACWIVFFQFAFPCFKYFLYLFADKELHKTRRRAIFSVVAFFFVLGMFVSYVPIPQSTSVQGVLWLPQDAMVRAETSGLIVEVLVENGDWVEVGQPLFRLSNPELSTELQSKKAAYKEYRVRQQQAWNQDLSQSQLFEEDLKTIALEIRHLKLQVQNLVVKSKSKGHFKLTRSHKMPGYYMRQGDILGVIANEATPKVRVALTQEAVGLVRSSTEKIKVRLASRPEKSLYGEVVSEVPGGAYDLPSAILGTGGGGSIVIDKGDEQMKKTTERIFLLEIALPAEKKFGYYGERAYVKFYHPAKPVAKRLYLRGRQLLISTLQN